MTTKNKIPVYERLNRSAYGSRTQGVRTELNGELDLDTMSPHEVIAYSQNNPGTHEDLARAIHGRYDSERVTALLETAALVGARDDPLIRLLESEQI